MSHIWQTCKGIQEIREINETAWRIVETQAYHSTRKLVNSIEEQHILEDLLEDHQPPLPTHCKSHHPLLALPFRYPPLPYGSRFGKRSSPSLWYGSTQLKTCLAEKAYYQFHFVLACEAALGIIETSLTAFSVNIHTVKGIDLTTHPFSTYTQQISSKTTYTDSQALGASMRDTGIDAFIYTSARDLRSGTNIALFNSNPFQGLQPNKQSFQSWHCTTTQTQVEFTLLNHLTSEAVSYTLDHFLVDNHFPLPTN